MTAAQGVSGTVDGTGRGMTDKTCLLSSGIDANSIISIGDNYEILICSVP